MIYQEIFHIYLILSFKFIYCMKFDHLFQQRQSYRLLGIPNDFYVMKNVCTENLQLRKIT